MKRMNLKAPEICLALLVFLYTVAALFRLGSAQVPETAWQSNEKGKEIVLDFGEEKEIAGFVYYLGNYENRVFSLETGSGTPVIWKKHDDVEMRQVYQWGYVKIETDCRYVRLKTEKVYTELKELLFFDKKGRSVVPENASEYGTLFDESDCYPGRQSFHSGTVFDETVYARTAYEYLHGIRSFENTHPPFGKILVSIGIACFGMNPFGWRFAGAVSGALMLAGVWAFARRLLKNDWVSFWVTAIFAADFMHFTQTRLAQVDSFLVLFMIGMYYFMYRYGEIVLGKQVEHKQRIWSFLAFSGICMGCAVSCKWSGFYGAAGLAVIWLAVTIMGEKQRFFTIRECWKICAWCVLFFIAVPMSIYVLSYIPFVPGDPDTGFIKKVIGNQATMFRYHTRVNPVHPQGSKWFQWPLIGTPIKYGSVRWAGRQESVILLGNPAFWLPGIAAFFESVYEWWTSKDKRMAFLIIMFLAPLLPWILVPRSSFLYHYFPCLPPMALMMGLQAERAGRKGVIVIGGLAVLSIVLFVIFYPIIGALAVPQEYVQWLEWLPWWNFTGA